MAGKLKITNSTGGIVSNNVCSEINIVDSDVVLESNLVDGVPCDHPGCLHHISHPCEGCGRVGGISGYKIGATVRQYHHVDLYDDAVIAAVHSNGALDVEIDGVIHGWSVKTCKPVGESTH